MGYFPAVRTLIAWRGGRPLFAIEGLCQDSRNGCFPHPAGPGKKVGMGDTAKPNRILECPCRMRLAYHLFKGLRPPFSGNDLIGHKWLSVTRGSRQGDGGERGIRTLDTPFGRTHDFQSCSFSLSDISPQTAAA